MSLALTVRLKVLTVLVEGLQSAEQESAREQTRTLQGIPASPSNNKAWNAHDRFAFLRDWVTINFLGIVRRASQERLYTDDVVAMIPPYLEPEVALVGDAIVTIGTRDHSERLAVPRSSIKKFSEYMAWFDYDGSLHHSPAVVRLLAPGFEVVKKGRIPATEAAREKSAAQFILLTRKPASSPGKTVWDVV